MGWWCDVDEEEVLLVQHFMTCIRYPCHSDGVVLGLDVRLVFRIMNIPLPFELKVFGNL